jgi:peroxiredoxin
MLPLGTLAPDFELPDVVSGNTVRLHDFSAFPALLVMFICRHCPYVVHLRDELAKIGRDYAGSGLAIVAISSNDGVSYPDDAPKSLAEMAVTLGFTFPLCYDESQEVAKAYSAACTPDFFVFDATRQLVYRGQLDESRPGKGTPDGRDLRAALDAVLQNRPVDSVQKPSLGCNIKWKPGNAP